METEQNELQITVTNLGVQWNRDVPTFHLTGAEGVHTE